MFIHNPLSGRGGSKDCNNRFSLALAQQPGHLPLLLDNPPPSWKGPGWQRTCSYWLPLTTTEFIWRASGKPSYLYFSWLRSRVCIRAGSFGKDITRSSEGRERMLAWAAQSSLALSRMTSSPARLPHDWVSAGEEYRNRSLMHTEDRFSVLVLRKHAISSKDRGIRFLIRRCHWRWKDTPAVIPASCLFTNTCLSVCLSLPWRFSSYFQSTFSFFQADQNKSFGDKAVFEVFNHTNILALTPLIFLLNLGQFVCLNFFFFWDLYEKLSLNFLNYKKVMR